MDNYNTDTIIMFVKMFISLLVIVGIPVIVNRIMVKRGATPFAYQAIPVFLVLLLAAIFWFLLKDLIF